METRLRTASLCLTDILEQAKKGHSAFSRSDKNDKVYFNVSIWDKVDDIKFGQDVSIQLNPAKDTDFEKTYIGNGKKHQYTPSQTQNTPENPVIPEGTNTHDLPF